MTTPQSAFSDTTGSPITVAGIAAGSYAAGKVIGTPFEIKDVANGEGRGFMITDILIYMLTATAPTVNLLFFSTNPGFTDNGAVTTLQTLIGAISSEDMLWFAGASECAGYAKNIISRRVSGTSIWGVLTSGLTSVTIPTAADGVRVTTGISKD